MKKISILMLGLALTAGCAMKQKVLDASVVSMTQTHMPDGSKLQEVGAVTGTFCADAMHDKGPMGLFDEAVKDTQTKNNIDFITNATFWRDEHGCILLEGTGQRLLVSRAGATSTSPVAVPTKKKHQ
jgi:hypothetical protein